MKFLLVKSTGGAGLGDLIRAVMSGIQYALLSGRQLVVRWDDGMYSHIGENAFHKLFRPRRVANGSIPDEQSKSVFPPAWRGNLDLPMNTLYARLRLESWNRQWALQELSFDQKKFDYEEDVLVMWDFDQFHKSWNAANSVIRYGRMPKEALTCIANRHLRPVPELLSIVKRIKKNLFREKMIGVHIRKTFEKGGQTKHIDQRAYFRTIDTILRKFSEAGIFLATDNSAVEKEMRDKYPGLITTKKWFAPQGEPLHSPDSGGDRLQLAKEAVIDMMLLASSTFLVYPNASSFSRAARHFSGLPERNVFPLYPVKMNWRRRVVFYLKVCKIKQINDSSQVHQAPFLA